MLQLNEIVNWKKKGNFSLNSHSDGNINLKVEYTTVIDNKTQVIEIVGYITGRMEICIQPFKNQLQTLEEDMIHANFPRKSIKKLYESIKFSFPILDPDQLVLCLNVIGKFLPILSIKKEIFEGLQLSSVEVLPDSLESQLQIILKEDPNISMQLIGSSLDTMVLHLAQYSQILRKENERLQQQNQDLSNKLLPNLSEIRGTTFNSKSSGLETPFSSNSLII